MISAPVTPPPPVVPITRSFVDWEDIAIAAMKKKEKKNEH